MAAASSVSHRENGGAFDPAFSIRTFGAVFLVVSGLSFAAYWRSLQLGFIADDYVQIELARSYGPPSGWRDLAADALYRCRATSLVVTYWTEQAFGLSPLAFRLSSLAFHILNSLLVFVLGLWRPIGWKLSAIAACFFAVSQRHHEAVIWYAAVPELLVFSFSMASFLCWVRWLQSDRPTSAPYSAALGFFLLALLSKESGVAVVPLLLLSVFCEERRLWKRIWAVWPFAVLAAIYFGVGYLARGTHLHYNDGTFSLGSAFWTVLAYSTIRLLGVWGKLALGALWLWRARHTRAVIAIAGAWIAITLLPYSFLNYMPYVPSRHNYFASVGVALIVAAGLMTCYERVANAKRARVAAFIVSVLVIHQCVYLWTKKQYHFSMRAAPTEQLVDVASRLSGPVYVKCFPYDDSVGELALRQRINREVPTRFVITDRPDALDLCNAITGRGRF